MTDPAQNCLFGIKYSRSHELTELDVASYAETYIRPSVEIKEKRMTQACVKGIIR